MEINITDYLTHDEIKEICADQVRNDVRNYFKENYAGSNMAYYITQMLVSDIFEQDESLIKYLKSRVPEIAKELSVHQIFNDGSYSKRTEAFTMVQNIVKDNKEKIEDTVKEKIQSAVNGFDWHDEIADVASTVVYEMIKDRQSEEL